MISGALMIYGKFTSNMRSDTNKKKEINGEKEGKMIE